MAITSGFAEIESDTPMVAGAEIGSQTIAWVTMPIPS